MYWSQRSFWVEIWIVLDPIDDQKWKLWYPVSFSNRHLGISRAQTQRNYIVLCKAMIGAHQFCKLPFPHGINAIFMSFYWNDQNNCNLYENNGNLIRQLEFGWTQSLNETNMIYLKLNLRPCSTLGTLLWIFEFLSLA